MPADNAALMKKVPVIFAAALLVVGLVLFLPAWTLDYWEAWAYIGVIFIPAFFVILYFVISDPEFIVRRLQFKEKEAQQKKIIGLSYIFFLIGFLLPGFDHRFGWSNIPIGLVIAADVLVFLGYMVVIMVFRENRYASRIIEVEKGQMVISTGPYSIIRHPMYLGTLIMFIATPIALGSYWAFIPFLIVPIVLVLRILNEEEVLLRDLPGYKEYCQKTRYRLIPYIW